jgi:integral membrane protein (TIGR00529 family)
MFDTPVTVALLKIALTFVFMLFTIKRDWHLWLTILIGGVALGLLFGLSPAAVCATAVRGLAQPASIALFGVVFCVMMLSAIQEKTGQGRRLVAGLTPYMKSTRLRLAFFPALIGLLGVPGGAFFSCPMIRDAAGGYDLPNRRLVIINYWFRHIWESAWPLYPGYLMACVVAEIPPSALWRYTFPAVLINILLGWLFFLRAPVERLPGIPLRDTEKRPLRLVLLDALPVAVGIGLAPVFSYLFSALGINAPGGSPFVLSFFLAAMTALFQDKVPLASLPSLMFRPHVGKMLALILMVFVFKEIVMEAKVAEAIAAASGKGALLALLLALPAIMGGLTGIMLGFVGTSLPLLMGLIIQAGLYEERLCWVMLALFAGHVGQMVTPTHSCYLVTLEFFKVRFTDTWRPVFVASMAYLALCCAYTAALYHFAKPVFP